jgi:hypothetical protein
MPEKSQVESREHQDDSNIHYQPFPESNSEEREIHSDYDGDHRHHVKHDNYPVARAAHFALASATKVPRTACAGPLIGGICSTAKRRRLPSGSL